MDNKGEYIQSLVDSRENEDSSIAQNTMLRHQIANLNHIITEYQEVVSIDDNGNPQGDPINDPVNKRNDPVNDLVN